MPSYEIRWEGARAESGATTLGPPQVLRAADWMDALGQALDRYGLERRTLERAVCLLTQDGVIDVADPDTGSRFVVRQVEGDDDPVDLPSIHNSELLPAAELLDAPEIGESNAFVHLDLADPRVMNALAADLAALPTGTSQQVASLSVLDVLLRHLPAESGSVLIADERTRKVHFVAARGPAADALRGVSVPASRGVVGVVIRTGTSLLLHEVQASPDHYNAVDIASGYSTRSLLACPVRVRNHNVGAIELLNPFGGASFSEGHRQVAELAARRLGALLS